MINALVATLLFGSYTLAQVGEPRIAGRARDASGQALPGVLVTAEPVSGPDAFTATTDVEGQYRMTVPAGRYRVSFRLAGYATHVAPEIVVGSGETRELEVILYIALSTNVVVTGRSTFRNLASIDSSWDLIGIADAASTGVIPASELEERSLLRPADVLERVPGLVVSQHSGEGKGNQYYVRGFNIDHGTDLALSGRGRTRQFAHARSWPGLRECEFSRAGARERDSVQQGTVPRAGRRFFRRGSGPRGLLEPAR